MNYQKIYDDICKRGQERKLPKDVYTEKHHIIPKCMGGGNEKTNITKLTAKEHFLVHLILAWKLYPTHYGLNHALYLMCHTKSAVQFRITPSSSLYELIRVQSIQMMTEHKKLNSSKGNKNHMFGRTHTDDVKAKISAAQKGNQHRLGMKHTEETKRKIAETKQQKRQMGILPSPKPPFTEGHKLNISIARKKAIKNGTITPVGISIIDIKTGNVFPSKTATMKHFGITRHYFECWLAQGIFKYA